MLVHAKHAGEQVYTTVYLSSPHTDVAVIGVSLAAQLPVRLV